MGKERQMKNICQQSFQAPLTKHSSFILLLFFYVIGRMVLKQQRPASRTYSSFFILHSSFKVQIYTFFMRI